MKKIFTFTISLILLVLPIFSFAQNTSPDGGIGSDDPKSSSFSFVPCDNVSVECDFVALLAMAQRIMKYLLYLSVPLTVGIIFYIAFKLLISQGDYRALEDAKKKIVPVIWGTLLVFGAWLIVREVLNYVLEDTIGGAKKEDVIFLNQEGKTLKQN